MLTYGSRNWGTFTEYLSHLYEFELFPCPNSFTPCRLFLRGKPVVFGHLVSKTAQIFREGTPAEVNYCSREDSNLHGLPHTVLSRTRLPIPPREQKIRRQLKLRRLISGARRNHHSRIWNCNSALCLAAAFFLCPRLKLLGLAGFA